MYKVSKFESDWVLLLSTLIEYLLSTLTKYTEWALWLGTITDYSDRVLLVIWLCTVTEHYDDKYFYYCIAYS